MRALARTLVLSGFGMTLVGGSYPASQGEHLISHYLEMMKPAHLAEALPRRADRRGGDRDRRHPARDSRADAPPFVQPHGDSRATTSIAHFGAALGEAVLARAVGEGARHARAPTRSTRGSRRAGPTSARGSPPHATTPQPSRRSSSPPVRRASPPTFGYPDALFATAIAHAREIRDRFTFLDLLGDRA